MARNARTNDATALASGFGDRLRRLREERGLSQRALAEATGLVIAQVSRYERGVTLPAADTLVALADHLAVGVGLLLTGRPEPTTRVRTAPPLDSPLADRLRALAALPRRDRDAVLLLIDALLAARASEQTTTRRSTPTKRARRRS